jgi:hypothetical protein
VACEVDAFLIPNIKCVMRGDKSPVSSNVNDYPEESTQQSALHPRIMPSGSIESERSLYTQSIIQT